MHSRRKAPARCAALRWLPAILAGIVVFVAPAASAQQRDNRIVEIRVEGNRRTEAEQVLLVIESRVGRPIDRETIARDVRTLYKLGVYDDIVVSVEQVGGGYVLTYKVIERPAVAAVKIEGTDEIEEDKVREAVGISDNSVYDENRVEEAKRRVEQLYASEGYFLATVDAVLDRNPEKNQVSVTFKIEENAEVLVRRIEFTGNEAFSDEELRSLEGVFTQERHFISFLTDAGRFRDDAFEQDLLIVSAHYFDNGYLDAKVEKPLITLSRDRKEIYIAIPVVEGPQYEIGSVGVEGDLLWPAEELVAGMAGKPGEIFSRKKVVEDSQKLTNRYGDESYAFANVQPIPRTYLEGERHKVDLVFKIDKGIPVSINRILIVGNVKTRDNVIRREMRIVEGEKFNRSKLETSKVRIQRLGFFDQVTYTTERIPGERDRVNIKVEVTERPTGSLQIGAGFSSLDSFFAQAAISQQNLFGRGQHLELQAQVGGQLQSVNFSITDPRVFDTYWSVGISAYDVRRTDVEFDRRTTGGQLSVGYDLTEISPLLEDVGASVALSYEDIELRNLSAGITGNILGVGSPVFVNTDTVTSALSFSVSHDVRNDRLDPTEGMLHRASVQYAANLFRVGKDTNKFTRYRLNGDYYYPLLFKAVFVGRWRLGLLDRREQVDPLIQERFQGGGITNLRGYNPRSVGWYLINDAGQRVLIGGDKEVYLTGEILISTPWTDAVRMRPVIFFDAGNVYNDNEALFSSMLMDVGFGIRWFSPLGPIRFEFGWPLVDDVNHTGRLKSKGPVFQFTIGQF